TSLFADVLATTIPCTGKVRLGVAFEVMPRPTERTPRPRAWPRQPEPLTVAQGRVLRYLPTHLDYASIGRHLGISRHTVKSHAKQIYVKFGVHSRDEAVVVAHDLGLVANYSMLWDHSDGRVGTDATRV